MLVSVEAYSFDELSENVRERLLADAAEAIWWGFVPECEDAMREAMEGAESVLSEALTFDGWELSYVQRARVSFQKCELPESVVRDWVDVPDGVHANRFQLDEFGRVQYTVYEGEELGNALAEDLTEAIDDLADVALNAGRKWYEEEYLECHVPGSFDDKMFTESGKFLGYSADLAQVA